MNEVSVLFLRAILTGEKNRVVKTLIKWPNQKDYVPGNNFYTFEYIYPKLKHDEVLLSYLDTDSIAQGIYPNDKWFFDMVNIICPWWIAQ